MDPLGKVFHGYSLLLFVKVMYYYSTKVSFCQNSFDEKSDSWQARSILWITLLPPSSYILLKNML